LSDQRISLFSPFVRGSSPVADNPLETGIADIGAPGADSFVGGIELGSSSNGWGSKSGKMLCV